MQTDNLPVGARVRYQLIAGVLSGGQVLEETPEVRAFGVVPDEEIVPLDPPEHSTTFGTLAGNGGVSGGAATYEVPIHVPPGRRGMEPRISLQYSSRSGNGIAGIGWSLSGASSIHRCPQTVAQDQGATAVDYTMKDRLCLDGQRLMATSPVYGGDGATYQTEIESFTRVKQHGGSLEPGSATYFTVERKSGVMEWYGYAPANQAFGSDEGRHIPSGAPGPLAWGRVREQDTHGNFIRYRYSARGEGEYVLEEITYTGHGAAQGNRRVLFEYTPREDLSSSFLSGGLTMQRNRLTKISTFSPSSIEPGAPVIAVRTYALGYDSLSGHSRRSLLKTIQECAIAGATSHCKSHTLIDWQDAPPHFDLTELAVPAPTTRTSNMPSVAPGENVYAELDRRLRREQLQLKHRPAFDAGLIQGGPALGSTLEDLRPLADLDGDGVLEWVSTSFNPASQLRTDHLVQMNADRQIVGVHSLAKAVGNYNNLQDGSMRPVDLYNNGRAVLVGASGGANGHVVFTSWAPNPSTFTLYETTVPFYITTGDSSGDLHVVDFDGDGKVDILVSQPRNSPAGSGWCSKPETTPLLLYKNVTPAGTPMQPQFASTPQLVRCLESNLVQPGVVAFERVNRVSDFDGNGLPDIFIGRELSSGSGHLVRVIFTDHTPLSGGITFARQSTTSALGTAGSPMDSLDTGELPGVLNFWADVNGDGLEDLIVGYQVWMVRLNMGGTFGPRIVATSDGDAHTRGLFLNTPPGGGSASPRYPGLIHTGDFNGDGRADLLVPRGFVVRMCTFRQATNPLVQCENDPGPIHNPNIEACHFWMCPEDPVTGVGFGAYDFTPAPSIPGVSGEVFTSNLHQSDIASSDGSLYTMGILQFKQTGPQTIKVVEVPSNHVGTQQGDLYGDGLADSMALGGCRFSNDGCAVMPPAQWGGVETLPGGRPAAELAQYGKRGFFASINQGAGSRGSNLPPKAPELVDTIVDGMDRHHSWTYFPLASNAGRPAAELPLYSVGDYADGDQEHFYFTSTMNVVASMAVSDGLGYEVATGYSYRGAIYNNQGRGFQGFRVIVEDQEQPGSLPMRFAAAFHQRFPLTGLLECSERRLASEDPFSSLKEPIERSKTHWVHRPLGLPGQRRHLPYAKQSYRWLTDPVSRDWHTMVRQVAGTLAETSGTGCNMTLLLDPEDDDDGVDDYGNTELSTTTTWDLYGVRIEQENRSYHAADLTSWWLDKLDHSTKSATAIWYNNDQVTWPVPPPPLDQAVKTTYQFTSKRALSQSKEESLSGDASWRQTNYTHDDFGNVFSQALHGSHIDPSASRKQIFEFDTLQYFPTQTKSVVGNGDLDPQNHVVVADVDPRFGTVVSATDANGLTTTTTLDPWGRATRVESPGVPHRYLGVQRCYGTVCAGFPTAFYRIEEVQDGTPVTRTYFDQLDREVGRDIQGLHDQGNIIRTRKIYMPRGLLWHESTPHTPGDTFHWTTLSYDFMGRVDQKLQPTPSGALRTTTYTFDGLTTIVHATAPNSTNPVLSMIRTHNVAGQLLETQDDLGGRTHYRYDGAGNPVLIQGVDGAKVSATYNGLGHRLTTIDPDRGTSNFAYTAAGEVLAQWDGRGWGRHWSRDRLGRTAVEYESKPGSGWLLRSQSTWDTRKKGQLSTATRFRPSYGSTSDNEFRHRREFHYDQLSRLVTEDVRIRETADADQPYSVGDNPFWLDVNWQRSLSYHGYYGWLKQQNQGPSPESYVFEAQAAAYSHYWRRDRYGYVIEEGNVTELYGGGFGRRLTATDAWGNPTHQSLGNGLSDVRTYSAASGQLATLCVGSGVGCDRLDMNYNYDGWGNVVWQYQAQPQVSESFSYDSLHRLQNSLRNGSTIASVDYAYAANGNLLRKTDFSQSGNAYFYATRPNAGPHAVTEVMSLTGERQCYDYDQAGNQVAQWRGAFCTTPVRQVSYDVTHRPERITAGNSSLVFRYDGDGRRYLQRRQPPGNPGIDTSVTLYPFPGYEVDVVRSGANFTVTAGRQLLGDYGLFHASVSQPQGQTLYRHPDRLGSPAMQSTANGGVSERRGFDAFGKPREGTWADRPGAALGSSMISPRGFTGHEHLDSVGGLIHMNGRAYDPQLGRFMSVDPIIQFPANSQSLNPYSYLMNNPLAGTDPSGYACKEGDSLSGCAGQLKEGESTQVRATPVGSRISRQVGTITSLGNNAVKVTAMNGVSGVITNVGNGAKGLGAASTAAVGSNRSERSIPGAAPQPPSIGQSKGDGGLGSPSGDNSNHDPDRTEQGREWHLTALSWIADAYHGSDSSYMRYYRFVEDLEGGFNSKIFSFNVGIPPGEEKLCRTACFDFREWSGIYYNPSAFDRSFDEMLKTVIHETLHPSPEFKFLWFAEWDRPGFNRDFNETHRRMQYVERPMYKVIMKHREAIEK